MGAVKTGKPESRILREYQGRGMGEVYHKYKLDILKIDILEFLELDVLMS